MIKFKFDSLTSTPTVNSTTVDPAFSSFYDDSWFNDPWTAQLVEEIEHARLCGPGLLQSLIRPDVQFSVESMGHGVKTLLFSRHTSTIFYLKLDSIGENLYPYMSVFAEDSDIQLYGSLNPFYLAESAGVGFYPVFLVDFGVMITNAEQFVKYQHKWYSEHPQDDVSFRQLTNWNKQLSTPICIDMTHRLGKGHKLYSAKFDLKYKFTFVQSKSSQGKTFLKNCLHNYANLRSTTENPLSYEVLVLSKTRDFSYLTQQISKPCVCLIDLEDFIFNPQLLDVLYDTSDNYVFILFGQHITSYIRVPFESVCSLKLSREHMYFEVWESCKISNSDKRYSSYDFIVTEDTGSGNVIWQSLAKDPLHVLGAGGFSKVISYVDDALMNNPLSTLLVVIDNVTAPLILPELIQRQSKYSDKVDIHIIVPTSAEYCATYLTDSFNQFQVIFRDLSELPTERLKTILKNFYKSAITSETLDLAAFGLTFNLKDEKEVKSPTIFSRIGIDMNRIHDLILHEFQLLQEEYISSTKSNFENKQNYFNDT